MSCSDVPPADLPLYRERVRLAQRNRDEDELRDPVEDDPVMQSAFREAERLAEIRLAEAGIDGLGACLAFWNDKQEILREQFGIVWFTPAQMNPDCLFD